MATIKFGLIVTDARGKLGGHVFTKTIGGPTLRTLAVPANPQTAAQMQARTRFGDLSRAWNALSDAQQEGWIGGAKAISKTNTVGNDYRMSGKNLFISANTNRALLGLSSILDFMPAGRGVSVIVNSADIDTAEGEMLIVQEFTGAPAAAGIVYMASPPASGGKRSFSGQMFVFHVTEATAVTTPADLYAAYVAKFGAPSIGQRVGISVHAIEKASGLASVKSSAVATVTA